MPSKTVQQRQADRAQRSMRDLAGCDPDLIQEVAQLTDGQLLTEAKDYTGLTWTEFGEDILCLGHWTVEDLRFGLRRLHPLLKRYLFTQVVRMRMRARSGKLPDAAWCPHCGRGDHQNVSRVIYVVPPSVGALFRLEEE